MNSVRGQNTHFSLSAPVGGVGINFYYSPNLLVCSGDLHRVDQESSSMILVTVIVRSFHKSHSKLAICASLLAEG